MLTAILRDALDVVTCYLLFANRTEYDILLMNELDSLSERHNGRLFVYHVLSQPTDVKVWSETGHFFGHVSLDIMTKVFPPGDEGNVALLCGPVAFTEKTCTLALKALGYDESKIVTF